MRLSTRSRYGIRALLDIARHSADGPVRLREIAKRQEVSLSYLEHIVGPLIAGGILRSTRGVYGGVSLMRKPEDISVADVFALLEGQVAAVDCVVNPDICPRSHTCATHQLWVEMTNAMNSVLGSRTLADLMNGDRGEGGSSCAHPAMRALKNPVMNNSLAES